MKRITGLLIVAALVLSACARGADNEKTNVQLLGDLRDLIRENREARRNPPQAPRLTRAFLNQVTVPALEVNLEARGLTAILIPSALRSDAGPGDVAVWSTTDNAQVILRDGVLYATRGLGRDLASSNVETPVRAVNTRAATTGAREMQVRNDEFSADTLRFRCAITVVADTSVDIVELSFPVRHLRERCENDQGYFENDYYVDSVGDVIQSRQWAGPGLGFMTLRVLKK